MVNYKIVVKLTGYIFVVGHFLITLLVFEISASDAKKRERESSDAEKLECLVVCALLKSNAIILIIVRNLIKFIIFR